jgi:ATP-dependent helicase Lhr and Lhr-like helicase
VILEAGICPDKVLPSVVGFSGEQYAFSDAVGLLREVRRRPASGEWVSLSGADPLNLVGILTPGAKLAALIGNCLLFRDGVPVAFLTVGEVQFLIDFNASTQWQARKTLPRSATPAVLADLG